MNERSNQSIIRELVYEALKVLNESEGSVLLSDLREEVEKRKGDIITPTLKERDPQERIKWKQGLASTAQLLVKARYLDKGGALQGWKFTPEGEEAFESSKDAEQLFESAKRVVREEAEAQGQRIAKVVQNAEEGESEPDLSEEQSAKVVTDEHKNYASEGIIEHIRSLHHRDFEKLCAALLRGMGYKEVRVTKDGADGGIDVIAYADQLGVPPRIKAQAKHYKAKNNVGVAKVRELGNLLKEEGDVGILITASNFTKGCREEVRAQPRHIELIDLARFVELWIAHYDNMTDEDKQLMPVEPVYFLSKE